MFYFDDAKVRAIFLFAKFFWNFFSFFFTLQSQTIENMKRILASIFVLLGCCGVSNAQLETAVWYFGRNAGLDFNTPEPKILLDGAVNNLEGVASFSDSLGNLLFYTDGRTAWNREHNVMLNGDNLVGHVSSTESAIIMPWPGNPYKYFLFVVDAEFGGNGLSYSIVDMRLDGGLGGITSDKNVPLEDLVCEKVTAIRHENGRDFWLITRPVPGSVILEYLVDPSGIVKSSRRVFDVCSYSIQRDNTMINPETGLYEETFDPTMAIGYMRIAPNGRKIAVANASASLVMDDGNGKYFVNFLDVLDFDPATGAIKPFVTYLDREAFLYGVEFSNDVSRLYFTSRRKIFQMDLTLPTSAEVENSVVMVGEFPQLTNIDTSYAGALQLALNGKIYVAQRDYGYLGVIENPREKGAACHYVVDGQYLGGRKSLMGLPNFVPTYFLPPHFTIQSSCTNSPVHFSCTDTRDIEYYEWTLSTVGGSLIHKSHTRGFDYPLPLPGKYRITMTIRSHGVEHSDCRIFEVYEPPCIKLQNDTIICRGSEIQLTPQINDTCSFGWQGFDGQIWPVSSDTQAIGVITDLNTGCMNYDTVSVTVADAEVFSLGPDLSYCAGDSVVLSADRHDIFLQWRWADNGDTSAVRVFAKPGLYAANSVDYNYCGYSDTVKITELPLPAIDFGLDTILCSNLPRKLDCGVAGAQYLWNGGELTRDISPKVPGWYSVVVTGRNGCVSADSIHLAGKILPEVQLPADTVLCDGASLTLSAYWHDATGYIWQDMSSDSLMIVEGPGKFKVEVTNVCGMVSDEIDIRYRYCGEFVFPNIITPNGDGINDYFRIKGLDEFVSGWSIDIYNRSGRHVYHSADYHNEWNAPGLHDGVYFYVFYRGDIRYSGNVTVFRR